MRSETLPTLSFKECVFNTFVVYILCTLFYTETKSELNGFQTYCFEILIDFYLQPPKL